MSVQTEITRLSNAKSAIKTAIGNKGVTVPSTTKLDGMATLIGQIPTGTDTSDATAAAGDILSGKTAYVNGSKVTGTITSQAAQTITPGTSNKTIAAGKYLSGTQTIAGSSNLVAGNIKSGVSIFGVTGNYKGNLPATVTSVSRTYTWIQGGISVGSGASHDATNRIRCSGYDTFSGNALMVQVPAGYKVGVREYLTADSSYTRISWLSPQVIIFTLNSGCKYRFIIGKTDDSDITPSAAPALTIKQITWG